MDVRSREQCIEATNGERAGFERRQHKALEARRAGHVIKELVATDAQIRHSTTHSLLEQDDMSTARVDEQTKWVTTE